MTAFFKKAKNHPRTEPAYNPFDRFFGKDFTGIWNATSVKTVPLINTSEGKNDYQIAMAVPGLRKEDFKIDLEGNILTISCEKEPEKAERNYGNFARSEYDYTFFSRSITLPDNANGERVEASYTDGLLILMIPKKVKQNGNNHKIKVE